MGNILGSILRRLKGDDGDSWPHRPSLRQPHGIAAAVLAHDLAARRPDLYFKVAFMVVRRFKAMGDGGDGGGDHYPYSYPTSTPHCQPQGTVVGPRLQLQEGAGKPHHHQQLGRHGGMPANAGVGALAHDLLNFEATSMVPEGLGKHVRSSRKAQVKWYKKILEAYKETRPPLKTPTEAAKLIATALSRIQRADLEGVLEFYGFPVPTPPAESSSSGHHPPSSLPDSVQFVLNTLPVNAKHVGDGDGFTAYVNTADPRESVNVPRKVREAVIARAQARNTGNSQRADELQRSVSKAGYWILVGKDGKEILAKKYKIRMRGIDAPEMQMPYGEESKNALINLIAGKRVTIYVYGTDKYKRYVSDIYCDGVFVQEKMLWRGFAMHFKTFDKRPELAKWERRAKAARRGLWASENPEKPWEWRRKQRNAGIRVH